MVLLRLLIIGQSTKGHFQRALATCLIAFCILQGSSKADEKPPEKSEVAFSSFLLTWDVLQEVIWKQWKVQFPLELAKWGEKQDPDGSSLLIDEFGEPRMSLQVVSELNSGHTTRIISLDFRNMKGSILFKVDFRSFGQNLQPYDINRIKKGDLPVSSHDLGEEYVDMKMWIVDRFIFRIKTYFEVQGDTRWVKGKILSSDDSPFLTYSERSSPNQRYFRYDFNRSLGYGGSSIPQSIMVVKTKIPGQYQGSEEYFLNDAQTDAKMFRDAFDGSITSWVFNQWQPGMASLLILLQHPDLRFN